MSEIVNSWWFGRIGIVKCHDNITKTDKYYIGLGYGINEEADEKHIKDFGMPFFPEEFE